MLALVILSFLLSLGSAVLSVWTFNLWKKPSAPPPAEEPEESRTEELERRCRIGVGYAEQVGGTSSEKLAHAMEAAHALGPTQFSGAEVRIGVESALARGALPAPKVET